MKAIDAIVRDDVEPDRYDDLEAEMRMARDLAGSIWCPPAARQRLRAYMRKVALVQLDLEAEKDPAC